VVRVGLGQHRLDLGGRDHRHEAHEQAEEREEEAEAADQAGEVPDRRPEVGPGDGRKSWCSEVTMITKRSNHIPMLTKIEITNSATTLSRSFLNQKSCGTSTLQLIIVQ
jgi:hypothetical protein